MGYIQVDQGVVNHRKTLRLARLLGEDRYTITGRLVALWSWCLDSAVTGSLADIEPDILADIMGYPGKPAELVEGLLTVGFLDLDDAGRLRVHNWDLRMGQFIQARADAAERQRQLILSREQSRADAAERQRRHRDKVRAVASTAALVMPATSTLSTLETRGTRETG